MPRSDRRDADLFFADLLGPPQSTRTSPTAEARSWHMPDSSWEVVALPHSMTPPSAMARGDVAIMRARGEGRLMTARIVGSEIEARALYQSDGRVRADTVVLRRPDAAETSTSPVSKFGGLLWTFSARAAPMQVAVFCPRAAGSLAEIDVLLFVHGMNRCKPREQHPPASYVAEPPFALGEIVARSNRGIVLVVPFLDWEGRDARSGGAPEIGQPAKLNGVIAEVLGELGRVSGRTAPTLRKLLIAGHSRAYDVLDKLAQRHARPSMSQGALAKLSRVWALDTTYVQWGPVNEYVAWLNAKPDLQVEVFYREARKTKPRGDRFMEAMRNGADRLRVTVATEDHCAVPLQRLPALLDAE